MSKSPLKPMPGYVVIKPLKSETTTPSGFILPENENEKPLSGEVIAVGADTCQTATSKGKCDCGCDCGNDCNCGCADKAPVKVGDKVVYKKWGGNEVSLNDEDYQILKFEDVLAQII